MKRRDFILQTVMRAPVGLALAYLTFGEAAAPDPITATKLNDRLVMLSGDGGNVLIVIAEDDLMMVDGGFPERADDMANAVSRVDQHKVRIMFNTHWHFDHTGSNELQGGRGAKIIGHENVKKRLREGVISEALNIMHRASLNEKLGPLKPEGLPKETFTAGGKMTFGKERIEYTYFPFAHTDGDTFLFFPDSNVLHSGDLLFSRMYPVIDYSTGGWIGGMAAGCEALLKIGDEKTTIVPGHGPIATKEDLRASREMLLTVHERLVAFAKQGRALDEVIALKPTHDLDQKWATSRTPEVFLRMAYPGLASHL